MTIVYGVYNRYTTPLKHLIFYFEICKNSNIPILYDVIYSVFHKLALIHLDSLKFKYSGLSLKGHSRQRTPL